MLEFQLANGDVVRCTVDPDHAEQLTREEHHRRGALRHWTFTPEQVDTFASGNRSRYALPTPTTPSRPS